ncbi:shikimate dehydrogenase [Xanthobacter sp. KR7-225]|uniref:shikimate dehydrogenase n=1 Tax=Xanthobacter sp. KR7-225 TaxID=3156613 RepID=UPI0032B35F84
MDTQVQWEGRSLSKSGIIVGMIGTDIQRSQAPEMHMLEGDALGARYVYRRIDLAELGLGAENLPALLEGAVRLGYNGLVITHPCKQAVMPLLDSISDTAKRLDAVNVVVVNGDKTVGHNTDWYGFAEAFRHEMGDMPKARVVQMGAGGAGSAVAYAAMRLRVGKLVLFDPDTERAARVVDSLAGEFGADHIALGTDVAAELERADGLINASPVGMDGHPGSPVDLTLLRKELWVVDIIYFPEETELLAAARRIGARAMNGRAMSAFQVAEQMRLFSGLAADPLRILASARMLAQRPRA